MDPLKRAAEIAGAGGRVAVISVSEHHARSLGDVVHSHAPEAKRFVTNGEARIEFEGGGVVHLRGRGRGASWVRGRVLDYVVMDDHATIQDESLMANLIPCFATTDPHGRIAVIG